MGKRINKQRDDKMKEVGDTILKAQNINAMQSLQRGVGEGHSSDKNSKKVEK